MRGESDQESLQADEQMRAATQKLRELVGQPPVVDESGSGLATTDHSAYDEGDGVDDRRENGELE